MNKKEAIDKLKKQLILNSEIAGSEFDKGYNYAIKIAIAAVVELDELEKPIVPQFVADWYEKSKNDFENNLAYLINDYFKANIEDNDLRSWFGFDLNKDQPIKTLVNMHQFGYKVEKEKLYTVEIPNPHGLGHTVLVKDMYGNTFITYTTDSNWREGKVNHLTESEIKKDFPWAWQFAEEVKE